jgi:hypothetical protein
MSVPVLDRNKIPLMPCSEKRAAKLMDKGQAKPYWQKGIFCIKLTKEPSARNYQEVALGIDPGSKREGYTVATKNNVVLNITTNTPDWIKIHMETRRNLRKTRRYRKTPYRKCRLNRKINKGFICPSTKARWCSKLRIINLLRRILPISLINVEDIKAEKKEGKSRWNRSFSGLETGKNWFYKEIVKLNIKLILTKGTDTAEHRKQRGFKKSKKKLDYIWETHNVDSHSLAEIVLEKEIKPYTGMYRIDFLRYRRRQLHVQNPIKNGKRRQYGGTVSLGLSRGSVLRYIGNNKSWKNKIYYLSGTSNGQLTILDLKDDRKVSHCIKIIDINILYISKYKVLFCK